MLFNTMRIKYVDVLKGIAIITVIFNHSMGDTGILMKYITSFHMFLFIFVSGYMFDLDKYRKDYLLYYKKKFQTIVKPYIIFVLINTVLNKIIDCYYGIHYFKEYYMCNIYHSNLLFGAIWFLVCLFWIVLIGNFIINHFSNNIFRIAVSFVIMEVSLIGLLGDLEFRFSQACLGVIFYILGYILSGLIKNIILKQNAIKLLGLYLLFFTCGIVLCYSNDAVIMSRMQVGNVFLMLLSSLCSIFAFIILSFFLSKYNMFVNTFGHMGEKSLFVLCTHQYFIFIFLRIFRVFVKQEIILGMLIFVSTLIIEYIMIYLLANVFDSLLKMCSIDTAKKMKLFKILGLQ